MRSTITIMNAKGGVGKSTLVLTLAETLSVSHGKRILVVDSDAHASISNMLMRPEWVQAVQAQGRSVVDYFIATVLNNERLPWTAFLVSGVSDVDDARSIDLLPGGGHLTLFEREVSKAGAEARLVLSGAQRVQPDEQRLALRFGELGQFGQPGKQFADFLFRPARILVLLGGGELDGDRIQRVFLDFGQARDERVRHAPIRRVSLGLSSDGFVPTAHPPGRPPLRKSRRGAEG